MPTYEYECKECGARFERFQNMSDKPVRTCPSCGGKVRRLLGTGGAVLVHGGERPSCGRETPCCGRDVPCGQCEEQ